MKFNRLLCNGKQNPLGIATNVRFHWNYAGEGKREEKQLAFRVTVWDENGNTVIDSGKMQGPDMQFEATGSALGYEALYFWQVRAWTDGGEILSDVQTFETATERLADAAWIDCGMTAEDEPSAPIFKRSFSLGSELLRARLYISGLGLIRCKIGGKDCTGGMLLPPYTCYDRQVYFETMDITPFLKQGENELTVQLGGGYNKDYSRWGDRYFTPKGLRAMIVLIYRDGTRERIATDEGWCWQDSPVTANGLYLGEEYDARRAFTKTRPAVIAPEHAPKGRLMPDEMPSVTVIEELAPVSQWEIDGGTLYDFGKNMQGVCRIAVCASEGCTLSMQYAELITPEGRIDLFTNRRARAMDIYTCAGTGEESYQPAFTYHGFRYVFVKSTAPVTEFHITALFFSADVGERAYFTCSEPIVNRMHELCTTSFRANLVSIPTDCPVRDERTPCWMDSQMYEDAAMYNYDMYAYYKKWFHDCTAHVTDSFRGNMDWNGDPLMLAYRIYLFYGDLSPAADRYDIFKNTIEGWLEKSDGGIWTEGYGDWCLPNENRWETFFGCPAATNTSLLHAYTGIMAEFARLLSRKEDEERFLAIGKTIRDAFIARLWHEDGTVGGGRQPEMLMPLFYGILTGEKAEKTKQALIKKIREDRCFDVGGFSLRTVLPVLANADALDLFLETARFNHYPGFGYWVAMGATSLWEQWASKGTMHSHNHAMHGGIDAALFQTLCGVVPTSPAFRSFRIAPRLPEDMRFVRCALHTYAGNIEVSVEKLSDSLVLSCTVPPNTEASLTFPDFDRYGSCLLFDGERLIEKTETMRLGSGTYSFRLIPEEYVRFRPYQR